MKTFENLKVLDKVLKVKPGELKVIKVTSITNTHVQFEGEPGWYHRITEPRQTILCSGATRYYLNPIRALDSIMDNIMKSDSVEDKDLQTVELIRELYETL